MKPSPSLALTLLLLGASLGLKAATAADPPQSDPAAFNAAAAGMLRAAGLAVTAERRPFGILLHAGRGPCRMVLGEDDPHGTYAELYRRLAVPAGPLRFAWRGRVYPEAPRKTALLHFYAWRELARAGIRTPRAPVTAWAASPACAGVPLDWRRVAALPA
ncbi:MAG: hypothetical protein ACJ8DZ_08595 [Allosphingosinicella sp.]